MARNNLGRRAAVALIIDGRAIDNLGQDVPIEETGVGDLAFNGQGINGSFSKTTNDTRKELAVRLLENSLSNDFLYELYYNQVGVLGKLFDISAITEVNEHVQYQNCLIKSTPNSSIGGNELSDREWIFTVELFVPDKSLFGGTVNG